MAFWNKRKHEEWKRKYVRIKRENGREVALIDYRPFLRPIDAAEVWRTRLGIYDAEYVRLAKGGDIFSNVPVNEMRDPSPEEVEAAVCERAINQFGRLCRQTALLARAYERGGVPGYEREFQIVHFDLIDSYLETQALVDFIPDCSDFPEMAGWIAREKQRHAAGMRTDC